jgi:hypothetical protein
VYQVDNLQHNGADPIPTVCSDMSAIASMSARVSFAPRNASLPGCCPSNILVVTERLQSMWPGTTHDNKNMFHREPRLHAAKWNTCANEHSASFSRGKQEMGAGGPVTIGHKNSVF